MVFSIKNITTKPFQDQKPGTSGLRKKTKHFMQEHYAENFVQAILNVVKDNDNFSLVVGGDGRFYNKHVITNVIIPIAAANGVKHLIIGQNGILSTPAASHIIIKNKADGGILLTASHNPGGITEDFGIKYNVRNGGPAPEGITNAIFEASKSISEFHTTQDIPEVDISRVGETVLTHTDGSCLRVRVVDSVADYAEYMGEIFDLPAIRAMITGEDGIPPLRILANSLNGVMGIYVTEIFCGLLGLSQENAVNCVPLEDFGGCHPDPNLTYARDLVTRMESGEYDLGCAFDGDGDRNMIIGERAFFVSPCDSLAIVADNLLAIPYFRKHGVFGYARSMPTSSAVDKVAVSKNLSCYEVPTGWKFFGNLMDAQKLSLCGEESFGMGSNHIREKDGMWAVLAWLSILCEKRHQNKKHVSIQEIMENHWKAYGRNFFTRYDYEGCTEEQGQEVMKVLHKFIEDKNVVGTEFKSREQLFTVKIADNFQYKDPVDHVVTKNQGIRILFTDGSRLIFRLSGTGSSGATIRIYIDSYTRDTNAIMKLEAEEALKPLVELALNLCQIERITGRTAPTVIT